MPQIMDNVTVDGTVTATRFIGPLTGTASRATADASGNTITTTYATKTAVAAKQDALVSGTNIKTVNGESLLGSGDITIGGLSGTVGDDTHPIKIVDGQAVAVTNALARKLETVQYGEVGNTTYAQNAKIKFGLSGQSKTWCSLASNQTDFTLTAGIYLITYSFTPTTTATGISGFNTYSNADVWKTGSFTTILNVSSTYTGYLFCNGNASQFVWFVFTIVRLGD